MGSRGRKGKAELAIVPPAAPLQPPTVFEPPRALGEHGRALWDAISSQYAVDAAGVSEQLAHACTALDRAEACGAEIANAGVMLDGRDHPLLKHELGLRAFVSRTLQRLGLET